MKRMVGAAAVGVLLALSAAPAAAMPTVEQRARGAITEKVGEDRAKLPFQTTEVLLGCKSPVHGKFLCRFHLADEYNPRAWWDDVTYVTVWRHGGWSEPRGRHNVMGQKV